MVQVAFSATEQAQYFSLSLCNLLQWVAPDHANVSAGICRGHCKGNQSEVVAHIHPCNAEVSMVSWQIS